MKTTVIYHSANFDGIFCREIARKFLGNENVEYIGWNFGDTPVAVPSDGMIYILDLPVDRVFDGAFHASGTAGVYLGDDVTDRVIWIDHHKSSIETHPTWLKGYRIDGVSACRLAWQWFTHAEKPKATHFTHPVYERPGKQDYIDRKVTEPLAVRLAGEYDVWDKRDPDAEIFQFGLRSDAEINWRRLIYAIPGFSEIDANYVRRLLDQGRLLQRYQQQQDASVVKSKSFLLKFEGLTFLALNTARCNSLTFDALDVPETAHDALMAFCYTNKGWTFSLYHARHRTELDLSAIAVKYGGGGHRGACGFQAAQHQPRILGGELQVKR